MSTILRDTVFVMFGSLMSIVGLIFWNTSPFLYYFSFFPIFISLFIILSIKLPKI
jgi:hypothetical protein